MMVSVITDSPVLVHMYIVPYLIQLLCLKQINCIYMDHLNAHLINFPIGLMKEGITSVFTHEKKVSSLSKSEHIMHNE